jgi:predicted  nucleic acid-binding Zn-ribbon protein
MKTISLENLQKEKETLSGELQSLNGEANKLSGILNEIAEQQIMTRGALQFVEQQISKLQEPAEKSIKKPVTDEK